MIIIINSTDVSNKNVQNLTDIETYLLPSLDHTTAIFFVNWKNAYLMYLDRCMAKEKYGMCPELPIEMDLSNMYKIISELVEIESSYNRKKSRSHAKKIDQCDYG